MIETPLDRMANSEIKDNVNDYFIKSLLLIIIGVVVAMLVWPSSFQLGVVTMLATAYGVVWLLFEEINTMVGDD